MTRIRTRGLGPGQRTGQEPLCYTLYDIVRDRLIKNDLEGLEHAFSSYTNEHDAVRQLGRALFDEDISIRIKAAGKLLSLAEEKHSGISAAKPYLMRAINNRYIYVADRTAKTLGAIAPHEDISKAIPRLRRILNNDRYHAFGIQAALSGAVRNPLSKDAAVMVLREGLGSGCETIRRESAYALREAAWGGGDISGAFDSLVSTLGEKDPSIALHAANAFAYAAEKKADISIAVSPLTKIVAERGHDELRLSAITALSHFSENRGNISAAITALGDVFQLGEQRHEAMEKAATALKNAAISGADISMTAYLLIGALSGNTEAVREQVRIALIESLKNPKSHETALEAIAHRIPDPDHETRSQLSRILVVSARQGAEIDLIIVKRAINDRVKELRSSYGEKQATIAMIEAAGIYSVICNAAKESKSRFFDGENLESTIRPPSGYKNGMFRTGMAKSGIHAR